MSKNCPLFRGVLKYSKTAKHILRYIFTGDLHTNENVPVELFSLICISHFTSFELNEFINQNIRVDKKYQINLAKPRLRRMIKRFGTNTVCSPSCALSFLSEFYHRVKQKEPTKGCE